MTIAPLTLRRLFASHASSSSSLAIGLAFIVASIGAAGCNADVIGTGHDGVPIQNPTSGGQGSSNTDPSGTATGSQDPPAVGASGAPLDIEALFAPPTSDQLTPGSIFGVWAGSEGDGGNEGRLRVRGEDLTLAKRCKSDGKIAFVYVKVRATEDKITILESKTARLSYTQSGCSFSVELDVGEWVSCRASADYDCYQVEGTKLQGLQSKLIQSGISVGTWLKLSD